MKWNAHIRGEIYCEEQGAELNYSSHRQISVGFPIDTISSNYDQALEEAKARIKIIRDSYNDDPQVETIAIEFDQEIYHSFDVYSRDHTQKLKANPYEVELEHHLVLSLLSDEDAERAEE